MTNDNLNIEPASEGSEGTCPIKSQRAPVTTARYFMWTNPDPGGHPVSPASIMQPRQIVSVNGHSWRLTWFLLFSPGSDTGCAPASNL